MNQVATFNFQDFIFLAGNKLYTDTKAVAQAFDKDHKEVLRDVRKVNCPADFKRRNFALVKETMTYKHNGVEMVKETSRTSHYEMTKDGFMFLVMGFTGKAAAAVKVAFIEAFNAMADFIRNGQVDLWKQMQDWTNRNATSLVRASFGSRLMLDRKKVLPALKDEYAKLKNQMQPDMFAIQ
jgi:Rha family phage regulatory protein